MTQPLPFSRQTDRRTRLLNSSATFGDILHALARIAPEDVRSIERIARDALRRRWEERGWHVPGTF